MKKEYITPNVNTIRLESTEKILSGSDVTRIEFAGQDEFADDKVGSGLNW